MERGLFITATTDAVCKLLLKRRILLLKYPKYGKILESQLKRKSCATFLQ
jgi:hypothetical protein